MRLSGRMAAALDVLSEFEKRRVPLKILLADWARGARYAGSKDRAFISGLCLDVLRRRSSLAAMGGGDRVSVAGALIHLWGFDEEIIIEAFAEQPHGPGVLSDEEREKLLKSPTEEGLTGANVPAFCWPMLERISKDPTAEGIASSLRAPFDLRVNGLKSDQARVLAALSQYNPTKTSLVRDGIRFPATASDKKAPQLTVTPAYNKGWLEVQDEGSQIAALAAGQIEGMQVLDFCAGGGGKTLALASLMANSGQIHAYDNDAARLAPIFDRLSRAGVRNAQVISPAEQSGRLQDLRGRMDVVLVDAPCSGSGTWRRRPDTKWRLTQDQLANRIEEQEAVLNDAAPHVAPGGSLVYVTCSLFAEENEDRIAAFLDKHNEFEVEDPLAAMTSTSGLTEKGAEVLQNCLTDEGTLRLTPHTTSTDGFGITKLRRRK